MIRSIWNKIKEDWKQVCRDCPADKGGHNPWPPKNAVRPPPPKSHEAPKNPIVIKIVQD